MFELGDTVRYNNPENKPYHGMEGIVIGRPGANHIHIRDVKGHDWAAVHVNQFILVKAAAPKPVMDAAAQEYEDAMAGAELLSRSD